MVSKIRQVQVTYELTKSDIEALICQHFKAPKFTSVTWDITSQGKVRGATITLNQIELAESLTLLDKPISD